MDHVVFQDCNRLEDELHGQALILIERHGRLFQQICGARQRLSHILG
jgi:hypothetical protein